MKLTNEQLLDTKGGAISISASLINAVTRAVSVILDIGRAIGSSIYRSKNPNTCR